jgi:hypothetical protein
MFQVNHDFGDMLAVQLKRVAIALIPPENVELLKESRPTFGVAPRAVGAWPQDGGPTLAFGKGECGRVMPADMLPIRRRTNSRNGQRPTGIGSKKWRRNHAEGDPQ